MTVDVSNVVFLDAETTGLYEHRGHEIWELAYDVDGESKLHHFAVDLSFADPMSLKMNGFWDRYPLLSPTGQEKQADQEFLLGFLSDVRGRHIVGSCPSFDDAFLKQLLLKHNLMWTWHYHLIDVETLVVGALAARGWLPELPWKSDDLSEAIGIDPNQYDRHSAAGDVAWCRAQYIRVFDGAMTRNA